MTKSSELSRQLPVVRRHYLPTYYVVDIFYIFLQFLAYLSTKVVGTCLFCPLSLL